MRNRKFRLSDMIPNAWFHKLQEIGKGRSQFNQTHSDSKKKLRQPPPQSKQKQPLIPPPPPPSFSRKSYYFTRELQSNDGFCIKSPKQQKPRRKRPSSRPSSPESCNCDIVIDVSSKYSDSSVVGNSDIHSEKSPKPGKRRPSSRSSSPELSEFRTDKFLVADSQSCDRDIVIDVPSKYSDNVVNFDSHLELDLPPIITKKNKKHSKQRTTAAASPSKKSPASSAGGVWLRNHSPRIGHRKISGRKSTSSRRSFSDSMAVMKSSNDPEKDFRESMVEMIVENNIRASKDLEDLLACYLCLNADEYHDVIIEVFKQIWFHLSEAAV